MSLPLAEAAYLAQQIGELIVKLEPAMMEGWHALLASHRPELTANAPPENQEEALSDIADTEIKVRFGTKIDGKFTPFSEEPPK